MLGLRYGTVQLVPYHPEWARAFLEERSQLHEALQAIGCQIEHVGSTAVPGLPAKPILDIAVGLPALTSLDAIITVLARAGYLYRGDAGEQGGHIFVRESAPLIRTHHVHVVELGGPQWKAYLDLRDFLRGSHEARDTYSAEKHALAELHSSDRDAYTEAKDPIVRRLLAEARRATTGGSPRQPSDGVVILTLFASTDAWVLYETDHDPEHRRRFEFPSDFVPSLRHSEDVLARWEQERQSGTRFPFAVRDTATGELLGGCELRPLGGGAASLSYWTHPAHRRRGVASRAVSLARALAVAEFGFRRLEVLTDLDNIASRRVAVRNGFQEAGEREGRLLHVLQLGDPN